MPGKSKNIHTCPENAGIQNMTDENLKKVKAKPSGDESEFLGKVLPIFNRSINMSLNRQDYAGKWTEETLGKSLSEFFEYCYDNDLEPSPPMLRLWLGVSKQTVNEWRLGNRGEFKGDLINEAYDLMEMRYFSKLDKYAVSNIFKLKTVHGYVETTKVDVSTNKTPTEDEVADIVSKMKLD